MDNLHMTTNDKLSHKLRQAAHFIKQEVGSARGRTWRTEGLPILQLVFLTTFRATTLLSMLLAVTMKHRQSAAYRGQKSQKVV